MINEIEIKNDQTDLISDIQFSTIDRKFLSSSWDNSINIFDTETWENIHKIKVESPQLSASFDFKESNILYSAGLSGEITKYDFNEFRKWKIGEHQMPVSKIIVDNESGNVYSASWDKDVKCWDPRRENTKIFSITQDDKVHNICLIQGGLIVSVGNDLLKIYDNRNIKESMKTIKLKSTIRCVNQYKETSVIIGSLDGKIYIQNLNQEEGYSFKCHRVEKDNEIIAYPVNSIADHPNKGQFVSGGSDGYLYFWNYENKKKIKRSKEYNGRYIKIKTSINNCRFNLDGSMFAISVGILCDEDIESNRELNRHRIHILY